MQTRTTIINKITQTNNLWKLDCCKQFIDIVGCVIREESLYTIEINRKRNCELELMINNLVYFVINNKGILIEYLVMILDDINYTDNKFILETGILKRIELEMDTLYALIDGLFKLSFDTSKYDESLKYELHEKGKEDGNSLSVKTFNIDDSVNTTIECMLYDKSIECMFEQKGFMCSYRLRDRQQCIDFIKNMIRSIVGSNTTICNGYNELKIPTYIIPKLIKYIFKNMVELFKESGNENNNIVNEDSIMLNYSDNFKLEDINSIIGDTDCDISTLACQLAISYKDMDIVHFDSNKLNVQLPNRYSLIRTDIMNMNTIFNMINCILNGNTSKIIILNLSSLNISRADELYRYFLDILQCGGYNKNVRFVLLNNISPDYLDNINQVSDANPLIISSIILRLKKNSYDYGVELIKHKELKTPRTIKLLYNDNKFRNIVYTTM